MDTAPPPTILVIMGSVRATRRCPEIAGWVLSIARETCSCALELVDLKDWPLPADDEPNIPAKGPYTQDHTRAWSRKIAAAAGFIVVTPQYNWGYPAPLKNAIDHVYAEWAGKPIAIMTYGGHGGGKCAAQLRQVAEALDMRAVATMPGFTLSRAMIGGGPIDPATDFAASADAVRSAIAELAGLIATPD